MEDKETHNGISDSQIPIKPSTAHPPINADHDSILLNIQSRLKENPQLRQIIENIEQVIWIEDIHSNQILYVSPAYEKVWGRQIQSLIDDPTTMISSVHPEDRVQVLVAKPRINHKPVNQEYRIIRPDGSIRWIFTRVFSIDGSKGKPNYLFFIAEDITEQQQVDVTLRKTLDRSREQFDLSHKLSLARKPEAVLRTLMSAHEFQTAQRSALLFFEDIIAGQERSMVLTAAWQSSQDLPPWTTELAMYEEPDFHVLLHHNQPLIITNIKGDPRIKNNIRDLLLDGQIQTMAIFPLIASGKWLGCLLIYFSQEHHFDHKELRQLRVLIDQTSITLFNLRLLEVEEDSRHEAERANEIKTEFLAMISHELRTPLTSIMGFTTTLLAKDITWEPNEQLDFIQTIHHETLRLQELIDHLLDLSRLEAGMLPIKRDQYTIYEIVKEAESQINVLTTAHNFQISLSDKLPHVFVDAKRIAQVIVNLIKNATTFAPKGTDVNITANLHGDFVQINIADQGPGIPLAEYKKVFKAFQRGTEVEKAYLQGAGLGLAICKGLVEAHGGRIWIKKKTLIGTTISFTLPINPPEKPEIHRDQEP